MAIKVLLADDSELVRSTIRRLLSDHPQITLIGEATDFAQTIQMVDQLRPDLVLLDLHMADDRQISPPEFKSRINSGSTRVLAISVWNDGESQALAESFGAAKLLDKVNLGTDLIPTILQWASSSSDLPSHLRSPDQSASELQ
jgi:DNA-binding NarL/FixJ family response regulator